MREKKQMNIQLGAQIKAAREAANLTQEMLAERIEVSPQYVSDMERGVVGVSVATLKRLCAALGVSSDRILFGNDGGDALAAVSEKCRRLNPRQRAILCQIIEKYVEAVSL